MILASLNVLILFQVISEVAFESGPIGDEELARLCAPSCFPVMNLRQYVEWDGAGPDICAKFEVLDSICEKHLEALRTRLALLKTFRFLWVSGARTVSGPGGVTSALEQSGFTEVSLRLKIFDYLTNSWLVHQCVVSNESPNRLWPSASVGCSSNILKMYKWD